jgi:GTPase Era involved in 16S rRNA processing
MRKGISVTISILFFIGILQSQAKASDQKIKIFYDDEIKKYVPCYCVSVSSASSDELKQLKEEARQKYRAKIVYFYDDEIKDRVMCACLPLPLPVK